MSTEALAPATAQAAPTPEAYHSPWDAASGPRAKGPRPVVSMDDMHPDDDEDSFEGEQSEPEAATDQVKGELSEAMTHFRNAAQLLLYKAASDPAVRHAASEAERVLTKIGTQAEPFARQVGAELTKLVFNFSSSVAQAVASRRSSHPGPGSDDAKK